MEKINKPIERPVLKCNADCRPGTASSPIASTLPAWRAALLGTVAAGALMLGQDRAALAGPQLCDLLTVPGEAICTGDQSAGILAAAGADFDPAFVTVLNVNNLNQDIAPLAGVEGIDFDVAAGNVVINSDTTDGPGGPFQIITTGAGVNGISGRSQNGNVTITHTGDISAGGIGIDGYADAGDVVISATGNIDAGSEGIFGASGSGSVSVSSTGAILADADGILAEAIQDVDVTSIGDITSSTGHGIFAYSDNGVVTVTSEGEITASYDGIYAYSSQQDVRVSSTGSITVTGAGGDGGLVAVSDYGSVAITSNGDITSSVFGIVGASDAGSTEITSTGDVTAVEGGIFANGALDVRVTSTGDISSQTGRGINAYSAIGSLIISSTGDITSLALEGISAQGGELVQVTSEGDISAGASRGIVAESDNGNVIVSSTGTITANDAGIFVRADDNALVTSQGNITSATLQGIDAFGVLETRVFSTGNITAADHGIYAESNGLVEVTSVGDIDSATADGINTLSFFDNVYVSSTGDIDAAQDGIYAGALAGTVNVSSTGSINAVARGIDARAAQDVSVENIGNITAVSVGIYVDSSGGNTVVSSTGNITADAGGILAEAANGSVTVSSAGDIAAGSNGITADGDQDVEVTSEGNISSDLADGIYAYANSGTVTVSSTGNIAANSNGIHAYGDQAIRVTSVGNISSAVQSGIYANSNLDTVDVSSTGNIDADLDGIEATADLGVQVTSVGDINSAAATGIYADSAFATTQVASTGRIRASRDGIDARAGEAVEVTSEGDILSVTADGITAQSDNSTVDVSSAGNINAAQYGVSANGPGGVTITTSGGTVDGGFAGLLAVSANAGATINNLAGGTLTGTNYAIVANTFTGATVNNTGTVTGDVSFLGGGGNNRFDNLSGGLFNSGGTVDLGAGSLLRNAGTFSPGGVDTVANTSVTGNVTQTGSGVFEVDVDPAAGTSDRVDVTETANLAGNVRVQVQSAAPGQQSNLILSAAGGTTDNGLGLLASPALQASLEFPNANDVVLTTEVNFSPLDLGLNENQTSLADNLNEIFVGGVGGLGPVLDALLNGIVTVPDYIAALDQLIPEIYLNTETAALFAAERFNDKLLSCPKTGPGYTAISQGPCVWLRYDGGWMDRDGTFENIGFEEDVRGFSGGAQVAVAPRWTLGIAGAYETGDLETDVNEDADSRRYMLGGVIKYQSRRLLMALAGSVGTGDTDVTRPFDFGGFNATARSSYDVDHMGATFHAAYLMGRNSWYAKPFVDVNVIRIDREAAQESGAGAANLNVSGSDETYVSVTPALELGTTIERGDGRAVRPYIRAGVTLYGDTDQSLLASFAAAPAGVGAFRINSEFDDVLARLDAGLTLFNGRAVTLSGGYQGRFGDNIESHGVFIKGSRAF